ncbi:cation diffusion facilitator family transporter [Chlorobium sp. N1]|uniref:cation diffusion facilitator family transporter n=1 Tax=Chlorobium sp. N1 TaxID=2491138 RepID=UPI00103CE96E|nr:cation diffusion facilitator family transporter [Chlorobium sp. N1]TCD47639.1 cation transporter [Chlorobium sp. N1]
MSAGDAQTHDHHHHTAAGNIGMAFFLNLSFTLVEFVGGWLTGSTAILADAVHDLGDSFAFGQAWYFERLSLAGQSERYSYGYRRFSLVGALLSALILTGGSVFVLVQAVPRLVDPGTPDASGMVVLALIGVGVNLLAMLRIGKTEGMNARLVTLHLLEDVLGWAAVLVVAVVLMFWDIPVLDPLLAVAITLVILFGALRNLRSMLPVFLQAVPEGVSLEAVVRDAEGLEGVRAVHSAHIWSQDGRQKVFTAHLELERELDACAYTELKRRIAGLVRRHGIEHSTVEIEYPGEVCRITEEKKEEEP